MQSVSDAALKLILYYTGRCSHPTHYGYRNEKVNKGYYNSHLVIQTISIEGKQYNNTIRYNTLGTAVYQCLRRESKIRTGTL